MTINLHDITGQESGIILVETDDGRHVNYRDGEHRGLSLPGGDGGVD